MEKRSIFSHSRPWTSEHIQAEIAFRNAERRRRKLSHQDLEKERATQHDIGISLLHPDFQDTEALQNIRSRIAAQSKGIEKKKSADHIQEKQKITFAFQRVAEHMRNEYIEFRGENDDGDDSDGYAAGPSSLEKAHNNRAERLEHLLQGIQELGIRGEALEPDMVFIEYEYSLALRDVELKHGYKGQAEAERYLADMTIVRDAVYKARFKNE